MPTRSYQRHGLHVLERRLEAGDIDPGSPIGVALTAWRADLIRDLGGEDAVSTQQMALVDLAARTWLLIGSVDDFVLRMPSVRTGDVPLPPSTRGHGRVAGPRR
jgi:hypothetical protein